MDSQKHLFNLRSNVHYLNCAYKAPLLQSSEEAAKQALLRERNPMDISPEDFFSAQESVRSLFGNIINASPSRIAIVPSVSYGFSAALANVNAKVNGNAVTIKDEFPSGYLSLKRWSDKHNTELRVVHPDIELKQKGEAWNKKILAHIDEKTSVVLISSVHWITGLRFDLKGIGEKCASVGAIFLVDGTQSVGALPIDVKAFKIDALVCAAYKWLLGPYSMGLAYMGSSFDDGIPLEEAWMNRKHSANFSGLTQYEEEYEMHASRYNVGETSHFITMPILRESLHQIGRWGVAEIQNYCSRLIKPYLDYANMVGLPKENDPYFSNHLFSIDLSSGINGDELKKSLAKHNVIVSVRGDVIRVSVNVFNDHGDIEALIESITAIHN